MEIGREDEVYFGKHINLNQWKLHEECGDWRNQIEVRKSTTCFATTVAMAARIKTLSLPQLEYSYEPQFQEEKPSQKNKHDIFRLTICIAALHRLCYNFLNAKV